MNRAALRRGAPLIAFSLNEMLVAFVRMMIMARALGPLELGFASTLAATYAAAEQLADTAIHRFVLASPREDFRKALAAAHAIALARGLILCVALSAIAAPLACGFVRCEDWPSFAWLAPVALIRGFENLEIRVAERDYRYWPQLIASLCSHGSGLAALVFVGLVWKSHYAYIAYLMVQSTVYVAATHLLSTTPYRVAPRSPLLLNALRYSMPLVLNGIGQSVMTQGDRLLVAATLGVEELGLYAVTILIALVPISGLFRIIGPLQFAGLHNARDESVRMSRLRLYAIGVPMLAAVYSTALVVLVKVMMPLLFGPRFVIDDYAVILLGLIMMFRVCRTEPETSVFLMRHMTGRLAVASQSPIASFGFALLFVYFRPGLTSVLLGVACGELFALVVTLLLSRATWGPVWRETLFWTPLAVMVPFLTALGLAESGWSNMLWVRVAAGFVAVGFVACLALIRLGPLYREAYAPGSAATHSGPT
ncbi:hypothetical protein GCM10007036_18440 [Alsobacter metallidurans]|uniref:Polysaccharide biosynthesis protein n=1 Tax=Alsobacter metallidurans TaxID=340221 RepID=A0A917I7B1_9HYPH|nr:oligosaccharide flippase family protein [Alsobacter metallidurans]GGH17180.1 hypothetical protein GCM10007036_18440 [Alsobacter metallidurans]